MYRIGAFLDAIPSTVYFVSNTLGVMEAKRMLEKLRWESFELQRNKICEDTKTVSRVRLEKRSSACLGCCCSSDRPLKYSAVEAPSCLLQPMEVVL
jgi:hypothetical protein